MIMSHPPISDVIKSICMTFNDLVLHVKDKVISNILVFCGIALSILVLYWFNYFGEIGSIAVKVVVVFILIFLNGVIATWDLFIITINAIIDIVQLIKKALHMKSHLISITSGTEPLLGITHVVSEMDRVPECVGHDNTVWFEIKGYVNAFAGERICHVVRYFYPTDIGIIVDGALDGFYIGSADPSVHADPHNRNCQLAEETDITQQIICAVFGSVYIAWFVLYVFIGYIVLQNEYARKLVFDVLTLGHLILLRMHL